MTQVIEELALTYDGLIGCASDVLSVARQLVSKQVMTPREYKIYEHMIRAHKALWDAITECMLESPGGIDDGTQ